jgi:hypothetical protein
MICSEPTTRRSRTAPESAHTGQSPIEYILRRRAPLADI